MSKYLSTAKDVPVFGKSAKSFCKSSLFDELLQDNHFDINENQLDIGYFSKTSKKISFKDINFSNPVQNINLEKNNTYSKNLEINSNTNILNELENTSQEFRELSDNISVSANYFEDMENNLSDNKNQEYDEFSNKAYADLMVLVTKYTAKNMIISFFNKHSNHFKSSLPKILNKKNYL
ncbi:hypothetical protein F8M41_013434 [Gigaspora margarita]|uniref:Uncharacterized protein n=1 Tax=Gigaspora margarita TaxID=4874 RepID=A0A8H3WXR0_GIGMA|nr:hypothetical protein F8M41_013434 [Gigaspora margarita]